MEKKYEYVEISTGERIEDYMASDYALDKLGITVKPRGENGEMTLEQMEYIETITDWYFSGNWVKEEIKEDEADIFKLIDEECAMEDYIENDEENRKVRYI